MIAVLILGGIYGFCLGCIVTSGIVIWAAKVASRTSAD